MSTTSATATTTTATTVNLDDFVLPGNTEASSTLQIPQGKERRYHSRFKQCDKNNKDHTTFARFNHRFLALQKQQGKKVLKDAVIDLSFLQTEPTEYRYIPWPIYTLSLLCLLIPAMVYAILPFDATLLAAPISIAAALVWFGYKQQQHCYHFLTLTADVPVLEINARHPDKHAVSAFILELQDNIETHRQLLPQGKPLIPIAVAEMRRLKDSGMISDEAYKKLKHYLFSGL